MMWVKTDFWGGNSESPIGKLHFQQINDRKLKKPPQAHHLSPLKPMLNPYTKGLLWKFF